jgi:hypothetical protein
MTGWHQCTRRAALICHLLHVPEPVAGGRAPPTHFKTADADTCTTNLPAHPTLNTPSLDYWAPRLTLRAGFLSIAIAAWRWRLGAGLLSVPATCRRRAGAGLLTVAVPTRRLWRAGSWDTLGIVLAHRAGDVIPLLIGAQVLAVSAPGWAVLAAGARRRRLVGVQWVGAPAPLGRHRLGPEAWDKNRAGKRQQGICHIFMSFIHSCQCDR